MKFQLRDREPYMSAQKVLYYASYIPKFELILRTFRMGAEHLKIKTIECNFPSTESDFLLDGSQVEILTFQSINLVL